jgi:hypothetical protein
MRNERFCSLFAFVLRINVICTHTGYSIKERKMYAYRQSTIKSNPLVGYYLVALLLGWIVVALTLLFSILLVMELLRGGFVTPALESSIYPLEMVLSLLLLVLTLVWGSRHYRHWKRIEPRRLAAAQGDPALLAEEQPTPDAATLALPATFKMSMSKAQLVCLAAFPELVVVFYSVYGWLILGIPYWLSVLLWTVLVLLLVAIVFATSRQVLEVTEVGVRLRASPLVFRGMVRWNEAHLFAVYNAPGVLRSGTMLTYELASASGIVRWTRVLRPNALGLHMDPGMPLAEHTQAMKALCQLIAAQTGLPLYDLRNERTWEIREGTAGPRFERPPAH